MKIKIIKKRPGDFQGRDGETVEYYWYKAIRSSDEVTIEFGSKDGGLKFDQEIDINIEKSEDPRGGFRYKHVDRV